MDDTKLTEYIRESNAIEGIYDEAEVEQSWIAWLILNWHMEPLTHGIVTKVQKVITLRQNDLMPHQRGYYRDMSKTDVQIGGRLAPVWQRVQGLMDNWLLDFGDPTIEFDPLAAHIRFEYCHPFVDGNGRTGRMLLWWHQIRKGQEPTLFKASEKWKKYYPLFDKEKRLRG